MQQEKKYMADTWARFTTETNAVDNLEKALYFLGNVKERPEDWKWVIICCHSSLYGFSVHVASGSDDRSVITTTKNGKDRLITFGEALNICKNNVGARGALVLSDDENLSIKIMQNEFRNKFEHYNPCAWSIEVSGLPHHIKNVINVTRRIAIDINFYNHIHGKERERLLAVFDECIKNTDELSGYYA
jgi:hypothetical protein